MNKNIKFKLPKHTLACIKNQSEYIQKTLASYKEIAKQVSQKFEFINQQTEKNIEPKIDIASIVSRNNNRNIDVQVDIEYICKDCKKRVKF